MKRDRRQASYRLVLPNAGSKGQTPASLAIDIHYARLMLIERWTWERFVKLTLFLKMTSCEVASLVMLPHSSLPAYQLKNILPLHRAHASAVALNLTLLEGYLMRGLTKDVIVNPFPDLSGVHSGMDGHEVEAAGGVAQQAEVT